MRILVAEDDPSIHRLLTGLLTDWGYEVVPARDGQEAWALMLREDARALGIFDWNMPGMTGTEVIRRVRELGRSLRPYLLLLTARNNTKDIIEGLKTGASDYIVKPFDYDELQARLQVGVEIITLQEALADKVAALEEALGHVHRLQGLLPICAYCRKIRDDQNYWHGVEEYLQTFSGALFSHCICPDCYEKVARPEMLKLHDKKS
jgi:CheY-like chemotaxis protein